MEQQRSGRDRGRVSAPRSVVCSGLHRLGSDRDRRTWRTPSGWNFSAAALYAPGWPWLSARLQSTCEEGPSVCHSSARAPYSCSIDLIMHSSLTMLESREPGSGKNRVRYPACCAMLQRRHGATAVSSPHASQCSKGQSRLYGRSSSGLRSSVKIDQRLSFAECSRGPA